MVTHSCLTHSILRCRIKRYKEKCKMSDSSSHSRIKISYLASTSLQSDENKDIRYFAMCAVVIMCDMCCI